VRQADRLATLDGLRGVAAIIVVVGHGASRLAGGPVLAHFPLAVDFFFILSGYVIAHAYESKLRAGMSPWWFVRLRLIRLYPLIIAGGALGALLFALRAALDSRPLGADWLLSGMATALLIPTPIDIATPDGHAYAFNVPAWSLLPELAANFAYAFAIRSLTPKVLAGFIVIGAVVVTAIGFAFNTLDIGSTFVALPLGFGRVIFPFLTGVALFRLNRAGLLPHCQVPPGLLYLGLTLILCAPQTLFPGVFDILATLLAFPLIVAIGANTQTTGLGAETAHLAGRISFAVYILHASIIRPLGSIGVELNLSGVAFAAWIALEVLVVLAAAYIATRWYDEPIRASLAHRPLGATSSVATLPPRG
jgi:peptidoglycan/LPS O-acetylase OafA/YrhL